MKRCGGAVYQETSNDLYIFFFEGKWRFWFGHKNVNNVIDVEIDLVTVIVTVAL